MNKEKPESKDLKGIQAFRVRRGRPDLRDLRGLRGRKDPKETKALKVSLDQEERGGRLDYKVKLVPKGTRVLLARKAPKGMLEI